MNRFVLLLVLTFSFNSLASVKLHDAPLEWLIVSTLAEKSHDHDRFHEDLLVKEIFEVADYYPQKDELVLSSSFASQNLKRKLVDFLSQHSLPTNKQPDEKYEAWLKERRAPITARLYRVKANWKDRGFYYFNHVHTDISQDNNSLRWLKYTPERTFSFIDNFLKRRETKGVVAFCDHDTDRAFDDVADLDQKRLGTLRGIEWGGATHMSLVGIKKDWELLERGREYAREDSVIMSRSSEGFRIVNHPFRKDNPMLHPNWLDANGVEVWNTLLEGAPFTWFKLRRSKNREALAEWGKALSVGKRFTAVAGSDFHFAIPCLRDRTLHYPANFIPAEDKSLAKSFLMEGRNSILTRPNAPKLTLTAKFEKSRTYHMGENIPGTGDLEINLTGDFSDANAPLGGLCYNVVKKFHQILTFWKKRTWQIRFYNKAGEVIAKRSLNPKKYGTYRHFRVLLQLPAKTDELIRAEVWEINKKMRSIDLVAATNPIFINQE